MKLLPTFTVDKIIISIELSPFKEIYFLLQIFKKKTYELYHHFETIRDLLIKHAVFRIQAKLSYLYKIMQVLQTY